MEVSSSSAASSAHDARDQGENEAVNSVAISLDHSDVYGAGSAVASSDPCCMSLMPGSFGPVVNSNFYNTDPPPYSKDIRDAKAIQGSCGLYNLGNTCFMNSGLQSLISCAPLVKFFAEHYHLSENNRNTLTGHFFILLSKMWSGQFSLVHPRQFKEFLGFYHPQFEDYRQHDCQEFLALLLDTLHEQLNRSVLAVNLEVARNPVLPVASSSAISSSAIPLPYVGSTASGAISSTASMDSVVVPNTDNDDFNSKDHESALIDAGVVSESEENICVSGEGLGAETDGKVSSVSSSIEKSPSFKDDSTTSSKAFVSDPVVMSPSTSSPGEIATSEGDVASSKTEATCEDCDFISSSLPLTRRYTSRHNLDDVTSSDASCGAKPSLKRVSNGSPVMTSGLGLSSEDSNHSSVSVHSTDSEQSSAFKRLKIDTAEMNRNYNNHSQKNCVTSSSDCRISESRTADPSAKGGSAQCNEAVATSCVSSLTSNLRNDLNVLNDVNSPNQGNEVRAANEGDGNLQSQLSNLEDFYMKETKTLNTNVLISDYLQEIACDSEKFAKVDNRNRHPSKEINLLQEAFEEDDKADKVLLGQCIGVKDINLHVQPPSLVKPVKNTNPIPNVLTNKFEGVAASGEGSSKLHPSTSKAEENLSYKFSTEGDSILMMDEKEKNVQMQAYSKFNTTPGRSNIRIDLTDKAVDADTAEGDEMEVDSSDEEDVDKKVAHTTSSVEECSSIPNCLRHCLPSEVAMANEAWEDYLTKNDSVIVSTFQGQFRSTVVCSECSHVSVTYEPFMYLSLPIPHAMDQQLSVVYVSNNHSPVRYLLNLLKTDKIFTAKKRFKELLGLEEDNVLMAEVLDSHVSRILDDNVLLKYVNTTNRKIYAFEISSTNNLIQPESNVGPVLNTEDNISTMPEDMCLVSTSRAESGVDLPYRTHSQSSNYSFDSVNVNSPSSRDTMDLGFSDSEICGFPSPYFSKSDEDSQGVCQSTSGNADSSPWATKDCSGNRCLSWQIVKDKVNEDDGDETASTVTTVVESSSSVIGDDNITTSCSHQNFWFEGGDKGGACADTGELDSADCSVDAQTVQGSAGSCCHDSGEVDASFAGDSCDESAANNCVTESEAEGLVSQSNVVKSSQSGCVSDDDGDDCDTSRNLSRSCPSPEIFTQSADEMFTLTNVAGRLNQDSLRTANDAFYNPDDLLDLVGTSEVGEDRPGLEAEVKCRSPSWPVLLLQDAQVRDVTTSLPKPEVAKEDCEAKGPADGPMMSGSTEADSWRSCAICLEDLPSSQLLSHVACDGVFCQNCLDMSVKHTTDVSAFCCPICLQPANICQDFLPLPSTSADKLKARILPVCVSYRHRVVDNTGYSSLQLFGHPNIIHTPSLVSGDVLYTMVDSLLRHPVAIYSIMLTDGQGLSCSRCPYTAHCTGCEIAREGEITLSTSDSLTVHFCETVSPAELLAYHCVHDDASMAGLRSSEPTTIMDCFGAFTQSELLDEHNPWYCPQCERNQCAKKTMTVWRYPDNLIIHLKRFVYQDLSSTKVDTKVVFPHEGMDVRGFLSGPSSVGLVYDLYSVICHFGGSSSGHYTSFARHPLTSQWFYYNDETVSQQVPSEQEFSSGYVLFYQRQGTEVDFTPPPYQAGLEEATAESNNLSLVPASSSSSAASCKNISTSSSSSSTSPYKPNQSMALVLAPPPPPSQAKVKNKQDNKSAETEDSGSEKQCSPFCDYHSLSFKFESLLPDPRDEVRDEVSSGRTMEAMGGDDEDDNDNEEISTGVAEPDSTICIP